MPPACLPGASSWSARIPNEGNRSTAEAATASLVSVLRASSDVVSASELSAEAASMALGVWASGVVGRVQGGGRLTPEEARTLFERFRITTLIVSDLSEYDQVWGKYGKFTRATIDGQAVDLVADIPLWRVRGHAEVDEMRGRAFGFAMEQAVQQLADGICTQPKRFDLTRDLALLAPMTTPDSEGTLSCSRRSSCSSSSSTSRSCCSSSHATGGARARRRASWRPRRPSRPRGIATSCSSPRTCSRPWSRCWTRSTGASSRCRPRRRRRPAPAAESAREALANAAPRDRHREAFALLRAGTPSEEVARREHLSPGQVRLIENLVAAEGRLAAAARP